jgi:hypothetical protein
MVSVLIVGFVIGFLAANGLPHFVRGSAGKTHPTPFGKNSPAKTNVWWGWANWFVAAFLWHFVPMRFHGRAAFLAVSLGVLVCGLMKAGAWNNRKA